MLLNSLLLVEDNKDDEYLAMRVLRKAGIGAVTVARDGIEAIDVLLDNTRPLPDILLLTCVSLKFDGLDVLGRLRHNDRTKDAPRFGPFFQFRPRRSRNLCSAWRLQHSQETASA